MGRPLLRMLRILLGFFVLDTASFAGHLLTGQAVLWSLHQWLVGLATVVIMLGFAHDEERRL